jgi:aryl-alcohol dehydrogenase-like predicted oxidoreductase
MDRRDFLRLGGAAALGASLLGSLAEAETSAAGMEYRLDKRTGFRRSVLTLGGIVVMNEEQSVADQVVDQALEAGVNAVDVAPTYGDAELKLGNALRGKRDLVFLSCKTGKRDKAGAAEELRNSLQRLQTDHVDLYQFHGLDKPEELDQVLGPGGAMEAFQEAKAQGLTRFLGITGHRPDTLLKALQRYDFDAVMFPYNYILDHYGYGRDILQEALRRGCGILAIKPIAHRAWEPGETRTAPKCWYKPFSTSHEISLMVRWVLSTRVTSIVPSGDVTLFKRALLAARHYQPLTAAELAELEKKAVAVKPLFDVPHTAA